MTAKQITNVENIGKEKIKDIQIETLTAECNNYKKENIKCNTSRLKTVELNTHLIKTLIKQDIFLFEYYIPISLSIIIIMAYKLITN